MIFHRVKGVGWSDVVSAVGRGCMELCGEGCKIGSEIG